MTETEFYSQLKAELPALMPVLMGSTLAYAIVAGAAFMLGVWLVRVAIDWVLYVLAKRVVGLRGFLRFHEPSVIRDA